MFLGTYTPKLDDKGRLTLPAKFRDALAGGLMVTKSQDHSLAVYPRAEFEEAGATGVAGVAKQSGGSCLPAQFRRGYRRAASRRAGPDHAVGRPSPLRRPVQGVRGDRLGRLPGDLGRRRHGRTTSRPTKRTSPRPAMKLSATSFDPVEPSRHVARASWPLSEPALAYFPDARSVLSDRDLGAGALTGGVAMGRDPRVSDDHGHVPVLLDRCVELLTPALTRQEPRRHRRRPRRRHAWVPAGTPSGS